MRKFLVIFRQSLTALLVNKGRSFLTVLGIIIGIGAVIALISLGTGLQAEIASRISSLGASNLTVTPGASIAQNVNNGSQSRSSGNGGDMHGPGAEGGGIGGRSASTLTQKDLQSLSGSSAHPLVKMISGNVTGSAVLGSGDSQQRYAVLGTSPDYFSIEQLGIGSGSLFSRGDVSAQGRVAVLGSQVAADNFGSGDAVGQTVDIQGQPYKIIGVLAAANESGFANPNNQLFIPYTSAMQSFGTSNFSSIIVQARDENSVDALKTDIQNTLLANHGISNSKLADFSVLSAKDMLSAMDTITGMLTAVLAGLAAISLLVGGIGIMNIMLVSVTERTREIGLRKAVGARTFDILNQFVIEAVLLTVAGGIIGIVFGALLGRGAARFMGFSPVITGWSVLLAVGVSGAIGLIFGVFPASKAARLNPIDALRYE